MRWILLSLLLSYTNADICPNTNGTSTNPACLCGTSVCNQDEYCNADLNLCSTKKQPMYIYHYPIESGRCSDHGFASISDTTACDEAAVAEDLIDHISTEYSSTTGSSAGGCFLSNGRLWLNSGIPGSCSPTYRCLCASVITGVTCENTNGTYSTSEACKCGITECESGEYCSADENLCHANAVCPITDGTSVNPACLCGTSSCEEEYSYQQANHCVKPDYDGSVRTLNSTLNPGTTFDAKARHCYLSCTNQGQYNDTYAERYGGYSDANFWDNYTAADVVSFIVNDEGICYCYTKRPSDGVSCGAGFNSYPTTGTYKHYFIGEFNHCSADLNLCHANAACPSSDEQSTNPACQCGTSSCREGEYCNADQNLCSTKKQPMYTYHFPIDSGVCSDHGYIPINDTTMCNEAAEFVGLSDTTAYESSSSGLSYPKGCSAYLGFSLYSYPYGTGNCGNGDSSYICLCASVITNAACENINGTSPVSETCKCGTTECGSGEYCSADLNMCHANAACTNTNGTSTNPACQCGTSVCSEGEYCNADQNICSSKKQPERLYHYPITSGRCSDHGYASISDTTACDEAAVAEDLIDQISTEYSSTTGSSAGGCFLSNGRLWLNSGIPGNCSSTYRCLCTSVNAGVTCENTNGTCLDECGVLNGTGIPEGACDCDGNVLDECQVCGGDNSTCCPSSDEQSTSEACQCGTSVCSEGEYCNADQNICSSKKQPERLYHYPITSGRCSDHGYASISDTTACDEAAVAEDLIDQISTEYSSTTGSSAGGCFLSNGRLWLNSGIPGNCSSTYRCLCTSVNAGVTCENTNGTSPTSEACKCGNTECESDEYCSADLNLCHANAVCTNTNGTSPTSEACKCGNSECESGEYCSVDHNLCHANPPCTNTNGTSTNPACLCGTSSCESDEYCSVDHNLCHANPPCTNTNGTSTNPACLCGTSSCELGDYCSVDHNLCHANLPCTNTNGTSVNPACLCGTSSCREGDYCNADQNLCSTKKQPVHVYHYPIESGICSDHGYAQINDTTMCNEAAEFVGFHDTTAYESSSSGLSRPKGCFTYWDLNFYPNAGGSCSSTRRCLCTSVITGVTCENTNGTYSTSEACKCGNTECGSSEYCSADLNLCHANPPCTNTDGTSPNPACLCGTSSCEEGEYCSADLNLCHDAVCPNTDGTSENPACLCGTSSCEEGEYCNTEFCTSCQHFHTITLSDSYGDGWSDNTIGITSADVDKVLSLESGSTVEYHLCGLQNITLTGGGTFMNEISFTVSFRGEEVYDSGSGDKWTEGSVVPVDECGVIFGTGFPAGKCDCDGNVLDVCQVCGGDGSTCCAGNPCDPDGTASCSDGIASRRCICNAGYTGANCETSKTDLISEDSNTRANARSALKAGLKASLPSAAKAVKKAVYAEGQRKIALKAAKVARRDFMKAETEALIETLGEDAWKQVVVEDDADFEGYSDAVLAKRQAKLEEKRLQNPSAEYKIRYRAAPVDLPCSFVSPDLVLTREDGMDLVDPEGCVTIGVEGEDGVIKMTKNGEYFDLECNDGPDQAELDIGSNFTCQGRVWDIGSATTDTNDVSGCTNASACNYNANATVDDGACAQSDECGVCGGSGIPTGDCDCAGNQLDALGECGGSCNADADADGICDDVDSCDTNDPVTYINNQCCSC